MRSRPFSSLIALFLVVSAATGCAANDNASSADPAADVSDLTALSKSDVRIDRTKLTADRVGRVSLYFPRMTAQGYGFRFDGAAGDDVKIEVKANAAGRWSIVKDVGSKYVTVTSSSANAKETKTLAVKLTTTGRFVVLYQPTAAAKQSTKLCPISARFMGGPANVDAAWLRDMKDEYEQNGTEDMSAIDGSDLPAAAKRDFDKLSRDWGDDYPPVAYEWSFRGRKVYVVEESNDGGMSIDFYDANGGSLAGGSAGESTEFRWGN